MFQFIPNKEYKIKDLTYSDKQDNLFFLVEMTLSYLFPNRDKKSILSLYWLIDDKFYNIYISGGEKYSYKTTIGQFYCNNLKEYYK